MSPAGTPFILFGGEGGIRTPGSSHFNGFQDRRNRPLCHLSSIFFEGAKLREFFESAKRGGRYFFIKNVRWKMRRYKMPMVTQLSAMLKMKRKKINSRPGQMGKRGGRVVSIKGK